MTGDPVDLTAGSVLLAFVVAHLTSPLPGPPISALGSSHSNAAALAAAKQRGVRRGANGAERAKRSCRPRDRCYATPSQEVHFPMKG
jgi:hypothetical protein